MEAVNVTLHLTTSPWILTKKTTHNYLNIIIIITVLIFIIFVTIVGNVLVCLSVCLVRKLRRPCNYLLVSLAVSDLCVATLVMPIALLYEVFGEWKYGPIVCDLWVSFDVLSCAASILNLCMISVDRYYAITKPLEYGIKRTPKRMIICVILVWLGAACISLPPLFILGNEHVAYLDTGEIVEQCVVCQNFAYQIYATLGSFYIPLTVMITVYYKIFRAARRIVLEEKKAQRHLAKNCYYSDFHLQYLKNSQTDNLQSHQQFKVSSQKRKSLKRYFEGQQNDESNYPIITKNQISLPNNNNNNNNNKILISLQSAHHKKLRFQLAKERKASTTLGIIMSAFIICWLPFFVLALVRPFLKDGSVIPHYLSSLFLWLGYANSLLNPVIYATLNRDFRKPFKEILYFRCAKLNKMMREEFYHSQYGDPEQNHSTRFNLDDEDYDHEAAYRNNKAGDKNQQFLNNKQGASESFL